MNVLIIEDEHRIVEAAIEKIFTEGEVTVEATLVTKSGKKIPHVYTAVRTKIGDKAALMGFGIDITERKKAEQKLRDALSEVEALRNQLKADCTYLGEEIKLMHDYDNTIGESEVLKYVLFVKKKKEIWCADIFDQFNQFDQMCIILLILNFNYLMM